MGGKMQELSIAVPALHLGIPRSCCELLGSAVLAVWGLGVELCLSGGIITTHGNTDVGQFCTRDLGWFFVRYRLCGHLNLFIFLRVWYLQGQPGVSIMWCPYSGTWNVCYGPLIIRGYPYPYGRVETLGALRCCNQTLKFCGILVMRASGVCSVVSLLGVQLRDVSWRPGPVEHDVQLYGEWRLFRIISVE